MKRALTYDDILLMPQYSEIKSRRDVNLKTNITRRYGLLRPYVGSCMDTVCESDMAIALMKMGGVGCIHRFLSIDEQCKEVIKVKKFIKENHMYEEWGVMYDDWHTEIADIPVVAAIGVMDSDLERAKQLIDSGVNILLIDVAHGHHINVKNMITNLRKILPEYVDIIVGNICTSKAAVDLCEWGVDGLRVGIGGGSLCTTRIKTGHGVPNVTAIIDCVAGSIVPVMADGGIRNSGDISKALALGAECVMLGSLLAGTDESPGEIIISENGEKFKKYRGLASLDTKTLNNSNTNFVEGESTLVKYKGSVTNILNELTDGVKSALSYSGSQNLYDFYNNSEFVEITQSGMIESKPHLL